MIDSNIAFKKSEAIFITNCIVYLPLFIYKENHIFFFLGNFLVLFLQEWSLFYLIIFLSIYGYPISQMLDLFVNPVIFL